MLAAAGRPGALLLPPAAPVFCALVAPCSGAPLPVTCWCARFPPDAELHIQVEVEVDRGDSCVKNSSCACWEGREGWQTREASRRRSSPSGEAGCRCCHVDVIVVKVWRRQAQASLLPCRALAEVKVGRRQLGWGGWPGGGGGSWSGGLLHRPLLLAAVFIPVVCSQKIHDLGTSKETLIRLRARTNRDCQACWRYLMHGQLDREFATSAVAILGSCVYTSVNTILQ